MNSIWTKTVNKPKFPALDGDIKTDVLIIGGGMAGILCAHLKTIECDFQRKTNYVYSLNDRKKLEKEMKVLEKLGFDGIFAEYTELPLRVEGAVGFPNQAQFHPLKFAAGLAKELHIYEQSYVKELKPHRAVTEKGDIMFEKVIFATHFPIDNKHGMYFMKMYQHRSYVIAYKQA